MLNDQPAGGGTGNGASQPSSTAPNAGPTAQSSSKQIDLSALSMNIESCAAPTRETNTSEASGVPGTDGASVASGAGNPVYDFDYTPTPFNPAKTERFLLESIILSFSLLLALVLEIASAATDVLQYKSSDLHIHVSYSGVHGCLKSECSHYRLHDVFCQSYLDNSGGYLACMIIAILAQFIAFIFSICGVLGRACVSKYLVIILAGVSWLFLLVAVICSSTLRTNKLCNGTSLGSIAFKYGPSFPLALVSFIQLSLAMLLYFVKRCVRPVRYRYN